MSRSIILQALDAGYIWAPYIPLYKTEVVNIQEVANRRFNLLNKYVRPYDHKDDRKNNREIYE